MLLPKSTDLIDMLTSAHQKLDVSLPVGNIIATMECPLEVWVRSVDLSGRTRVATIAFLRNVVTCAVTLFHSILKTMLSFWGLQVVIKLAAQHQFTIMHADSDFNLLCCEAAGGRLHPFHDLIRIV